MNACALIVIDQTAMFYGLGGMTILVLAVLVLTRR
jgi:hypothetical protein